MPDAYDTGSPSARKRILVAEDDAEMRQLLAQVLHRHGYDVVVCSDGLRLVETLKPLVLHNEAVPYDLIISDLRMPWLDGMMVLQGLRRSPNMPPMILITAFGDDETHQTAERLGAAAFFDKPFEFSDLVAKVNEILT